MLQVNPFTEVCSYSDGSHRGNIVALDSMASACRSTNLQDQLLALYGAQVANGDTLAIEVWEPQSQTGFSDCGVSAIAFAFEQNRLSPSESCLLVVRLTKAG